MIDRQIEIFHHNHEQADFSHSLRVSLLCRGRDLGMRSICTGLHSHPFWQISLVCRGQVQVLTGAQPSWMRSGMITFLPPNVRHSIYGNPHALDMWTLKFIHDGPISNFHPATIRPDYIRERWYRLLLEHICRPRFLTRDETMTLESLLGLLLIRHYVRTDNRMPDFPLRSEVSCFVEKQQGRPVSVRQLARHLGYSIKYLSVKFHQETGQTLKTFLDQIRIKQAESLLILSDASITQIAAQMQFADVFAFSRFFKRLRGTSPKNFLAAHSLKFNARHNSD